MKGAKKIPGKKSPTIDTTETNLTERNLVQLLKDEVKWDLQPLECVRNLLELLDHIDDDQKSSHKEERKESGTSEPGQDDQECLNSLQVWLREKNHSTFSTNIDGHQDWKLCSDGSVVDGSTSDSKGNRCMKPHSLTHTSIQHARQVELC